MLCIPASSDALPFARTYTALAGSSPTRTTAKPGRTPRAMREAAVSATPERTARAIVAPSIRSAGKIHRPRFPDQHHLDLTRVLQLGFDAARNLVRQRSHSGVVDGVRRHHDPDLPARLNGEHLLHATVARRDPFQALESLHIGLERLATRAGPRPGDRIGGLHQHGDLALVRHIVVMRGDAIHDQRALP